MKKPAGLLDTAGLFKNYLPIREGDGGRKWGWAV